MNLYGVLFPLDSAGWHGDSLPGAGFHVQLTASGGFRRLLARRFPARGWVLAEQTCIARGSPIPQDGHRTAKAWTQPIQTLQRLENVFHNFSPSVKDASCARIGETWSSQVLVISQVITKLLLHSSHSSASPTATCNMFPSLRSPPASGWASRQGTTYGATKRTRDHTNLTSAASIAAQSPPRLPP